MKKLLISLSLVFSATCFADSTTDFVKEEASSMVDVLNMSFTKLQIAACSSMSPGRIDYTSIDTTSIGGTDADEEIKLIHEAPTKLGFDKRIVIHADEDSDNVPDDRVAAIVEFSCDDSRPAQRMQKGYWVQTGRNYCKADGSGTLAQGEANDLLEASWDNSGTVPTVQFRIVGTGAHCAGQTGSDVVAGVYLLMYTRQPDGNMISATVQNFNNILSYLTDLGLTDTKTFLINAGVGAN